MEFPHLNDTKFPNLNTVDVYAYKNVFDYTRWVPNTKIYLTNVRWNGDYQDVVKFKDDAARDDWFDKKVEESDCAATITSNTVIINGTVKVPMPYDVASQFNYLVVDVPVMTSDDKMIDYETAEGYRRWHFFITDFAYGSPSATTLTLTLDFWTQYINSVGISYMFLERGHAPVAETDTETYLANPIENTKYLLAPDVNYGNDTVTRGGKFVPFGNGEKYVCFLSVCPPSQISNMGTVNTGAGSWTDFVLVDDPTQPDSSGRWSHEHKVTGYNWGNGSSYANTKTPARNTLGNASRGLNNRTVYAVEESKAGDFVNDVQDKCPMFLQTLKACFIIAREMLSFEGAYEIAGHIVQTVNGSKDAFDLDTVKLTKSMFGIQDEYSRFAKLYTFPYSELEITDNNGKTVSVRIETTGEIKARGMSCLIYPYLNMRMFLTGIGGIGSDNYQWIDMRGTHEESMSKSDWYKFCFDSDVPCYELYMDGETSWELGNYNRAYSYGREQAIRSYHTGNEAANNARENAYDLAEKNRQNAYNSADTAKQNAYNTANAAKNNAYNDAQNMSNNHSNSRACASQITANNTANNTNNLYVNNLYKGRIVTNEQNRADGKTSWANLITAITADAENQKTTSLANTETAATVAETAGQTAGGIISSAAKGDIGGAIGSIASGAGSMAGALIRNSGTSAITNCTTAISNAQQAYANHINSLDDTYNFNANSYSVTQCTDTNTNNNNTAIANTNTSNNCDYNNTNNTVSTMRTNADNSYNAATTNADNSYNTATTNATNDKETARKNAFYTAWQAQAANWRLLYNAQDAAKAQGADAYNYSPVTVCAATGDPAPDAHRTRGIQIKVRTQSSDAIAQTASEFARYGYKLNQIYNPESLTLMKHFTYWKTRECWVYDKCETNDTAQTAIGLIFKNGVTVWSDPDEIGKVNPYDN